MPNAKTEPRWTLVQHSGYGYNGDSQFEKAVEVRKVDTKREQNAVEKVGGVLFESWSEATDTEEDINGVTGGPFLQAKGTFADMEVDGLHVYIPVRKIVG